MQNNKKSMQNFGYLQRQPQPSDDVFGAISRSRDEQVLCPLGDWQKYLPVFEKQRNDYWDTAGCVSFSALNCIEILIKAKWGIDVNYSDRKTIKSSGTTEDGNYITIVADDIRHTGLALESSYPFPSSMGRTEFFQDIPQIIIDEAKNFLTQYDVTYELVRVADLTDALRFAPIQVGVYAWPQQVNGIYPDVKGARRNHLVTLVGYSVGEYWLIYDSYEPRLKKLEWDYQFAGTLKYDIREKVILPNMKNNTLVQEVTKSGSFGLYLDGKIYIDDLDKILVTWEMRNNGNTAGMVATMTLDNWSKFPKFNLKNESL